MSFEAFIAKLDAEKIDRIIIVASLKLDAITKEETYRFVPTIHHWYLAAVDALGNYESYREVVWVSEMGNDRTLLDRLPELGWEVRKDSVVPNSLVATRRKL
jgi:hypothetical protein